MKCPLLRYSEFRAVRDLRITVDRDNQAPEDCKIAGNCRSKMYWSPYFSLINFLRIIYCTWNHLLHVRCFGIRPTIVYQSVPGLTYNH